MQISRFRVIFIENYSEIKKFGENYRYFVENREESENAFRDNGFEVDCFPFSPLVEFIPF